MGFYSFLNINKTEFTTESITRIDVQHTDYNEFSYLREAFPDWIRIPVK